jgi:hypothetical protein
MKRKSEFSNFEDTVRQLLKVPHSEIKGKLDAEKKDKAARKRKNGKQNTGT